MSQQKRGAAMPPDPWRGLADVPVHAEWGSLRETFVSTVQRNFRGYIPEEDADFESQLAFATGRFDEGVALLRNFVMRGLVKPGRQMNVLDLGAGNGGVAFAFANVRPAAVHTLDLIPNLDLLAIRKALPAPVRVAVGDGSSLPFTGGSFQLVLLLETIEHVERPHAVAAEIMRVLEPGGTCLVTTPARLPYLFRRDPHYGLPGIVALPNGVQRMIVEHAVKRHGRSYDVTHLYWHAREVADLFPGPKKVEVLYGRTYTPPGNFNFDSFRYPRRALEQLRYSFRDWFFDALLISKTAK